jgi:hypothetical protein
LSSRSASTTERFVGRDDELHQLTAMCAATTTGRGAVVVVTGAAGVGKSRLVDEVAHRACARGLAVVSGRAWTDEGAPPLWPWHRIVSDLCGPAAAELLSPGADPTSASERFHRLAAVSEAIAESCGQRPACVVIDDAHALDEDGLRLARFVGRSLARLPLVLILTRRSGEPKPADGPGHQLLDEIEAEATPVELGPLDLDDTRRLLDAHGWPDPDLTAVVHRLAAGNPRRLRRVAARGAQADDGPVPAGLRLAVDDALAPTTAEVQHLLCVSAVLGDAPSVAVAARVADCSPVTLLDAVAAAEAAGLVTSAGTDRFDFAHPLVRSVLEDTLANAARLDAHARAASVAAEAAAAAVVAVAVDDEADAEPGSVRAPHSAAWRARSAHHALAAASRSVDDARTAVAACEVAAASLSLSDDHVRADELLSAAVALHDSAPLGPPPARLLLAWARTALRRGQVGVARARFDRATTVADHEGDPVGLAEAALGLGGLGVGDDRAPVERTQVLERQRAALTGLPAGHEVLHARLEARLAAELALDGGPVEPVQRALANARAGDDTTALAEALALCHHVMLTPAYRYERLPLADELVAVATDVGDSTLGLLGLWFRTVDLFHLGDGDALPALVHVRRRADELGAENVLVAADLADVMLQIRAGRLDEAEAGAERAHRRGLAAGEVNAPIYLAAQRLGLAWIRGDDRRILDQADAVAAAPDLHHADFGFRAAAVALAARSGQHDRARAMLGDLAPDGLAAIALSSTWLIGMMAMAELAAALSDPALAREVHALVAPHAEEPTLGGAAVLCLGSTERTLGLAAQTFGAHDRAIDHFERAVVENTRLPHIPMAVVARADLAGALLARDAGSERASELLRQVIAGGETLGLGPRAQRWRAQLAELDEAELRGAAGAAPAVPTDEPGSEPRQGSITQQDGRWLVVLDGQRVRVGDLVGMRYLAELLARPGQVIAAVTLASGGGMPRSGARQDVLDDEARAAYTARARELTVELAEAEADHEPGRAEKLRMEIDALVDEIESATGLGGRARAFADPAERARTAVRKAIKRAVDLIDDANPAIAEALRSTITTGTTCVYTPESRSPVAWSTTPSDDDRR